MFLLFNKSQPASEHRIGFIYTEASKNNSADPASALRLRKLLKRVKRKDFGGGKKKKKDAELAHLQSILPPCFSDPSLIF